MHFIYFSIAALIALAIASPALEDRVSLSDDSVIARGLASAAANERRRVDELYDALSPADPKDKRQFDWLYDDEYWWDDYFGDFDTWVSENTAKRRDLQPLGSKDKRQLDWYYDDEDSYYDDWVGDFGGGVSDNAAKAKS